MLVDNLGFQKGSNPETELAIFVLRPSLKSYTSHTHLRTLYTSGELKVTSTRGQERAKTTFCCLTLAVSENPYWILYCSCTDLGGKVVNRMQYIP